MATFIPHFRLANKIGVHEATWPAATVAELIAHGKAQFGQVFEDEIKAATIVVNGRAVSYLDGLATKLDEKDEVWSVLPSAGG